MARINDIFNKLKRNTANYLDRDKEKAGFQLFSPKTTRRATAIRDFGRRGVQGVKQSFKDDPGQYSLNRLFSNQVSNTQQLFSPIIGKDKADKLAYGIRGASQLTPFNLTTNQKTRDIYRASAPTTDAQKQAQSIGRSTYGLALTAPLGGSSKIANVGKRVVSNMGLGGLLNAGISKATGGDVKQGFKEGAIQGYKNAPYLAVTNPIIEKAVSRFAPVTSLLQRQAIQRGVAGVGNVIEDEILSDIDGLKNTNQDRALSFLLGAGTVGNTELAGESKNSLLKLFGKRSKSRLNPKPDIKVGDVLDDVAEQFTSSGRTYLRKGNRFAGSVSNKAKEVFSGVFNNRNVKQVGNKFEVSYKNPISGREVVDTFDSKVINIALDKNAKIADLPSVTRNKVNQARFLLGLNEDTLSNVAGLGLGIEPEYDDEGNFSGVNYSPEKGLLGVAGLIGGKKAKNYVDSVKFSSLLDQKPRFEIDDSGAKLKDSFLNNFKQKYPDRQFKLGDILDHNELFKQYPQLKNVDVFTAGASGKSFGSFSQEKNKIVLNFDFTNQSLTSKNTQSTLLHEIQHAIQGIEGFAKGGSVDEFRDSFDPNIIRKVHNDAESNLKSFIDKHGLENIRADKKLSEEFQKLRDIEARAFEARTNPDIYATQKYLRQSGELESRAVQRRMDLSENKRGLIDPYAEEARATTGRTNKNDFITRFLSGEQNNVEIKSDIKPNNIINNLVEGYANAEKQIKKLEDLQSRIGDAQENPKQFQRLTDEIEKIETGNRSAVKQLAEQLGVSDYEVINALSEYIDIGKRRGKQTLADFYNFFRVDEYKDTLKTPKDEITDLLKPKEKSTFVRPQDIIFDTKNTRRTKQLANLLTYPTTLGRMGYTKKQIDKIGFKEAQRIIRDGISPSKWKPQQFLEGTNINPKQKLNGRKVRMFEPTDEEVAQAVGEEYFNNQDRSRIKSWFNSVFNPIKNTPEVVQNSLKDWRKSIVFGKAKANEASQQFSHIPADDGWKLVQFIQEPTFRKQKELGLDALKYKNEIRQLRGVYDDMRREGLAKGLEVGYVENYLNQVWKEPLETIVEALGAGKRPAFSKEKVIPTYAEGIKIGLTPMFTHPAQLVGHYRYQLDKALANKKMFNQLVDSDLLLPSNKAPLDWKNIDAPLFPKVEMTIGDGETIVMDYKAPPDIAKSLNNIFAEKQGGLMNFMANVSKGTQDLSLSGGIPKTPVNSFAMANLVKEFTAFRFKSPIASFARSFSDKASSNYFKDNQKYIKMMASDGLTVPTTYDYKSAYKNVVSSKAFKEVAGDKWDEWMGEATFKRFLPQLQVGMFKDIYEKGLKEGMDSNQARKIATDTVKNFYGVADNFTRPQSTEDTLSALFFAPKFREGMINFWMNNLKAINPLEKTAEGKLKFTAKNLTDKSLTQNRKFLLAGIPLTYAFYSSMNKALTGHWMHENKDGKELAMEIPRGGGRSWYIPMLPSIGTLPRRVVETAGELKEGDVAGATQKLTSFLSQPVSVGGQLATNRTFYGGPIYDEEDSAGQKVAKLGGYMVEQLAHPFLGEPIAVAQGRKTPVEALLGMLEAPIYPSVSSDQAHLASKQRDKYKELSAISPQSAEAYSNKIKAKSELSDLRKENKKKSEGSFFSNLFGNKEQSVGALATAYGIDELNLMGETNNYERAQKKSKQQQIVRDILGDDELDSDIKSQILSSELGEDISAQDVDYYQLANLNNDVRLGFIQDEISNVSTQQELMAKLATYRQNVAGKMVLTSELINDLEDLGIISKNEKNLLKGITWNAKTGQAEYTDQYKQSLGKSGSSTNKKIAEILRQGSEERGQLLQLLNQTSQPKQSNLELLLARRSPEAPNYTRVTNILDDLLKESRKIA